MRILLSVCVVVIGWYGVPNVASAADTASRAVIVTATFSSRTSLKVSADLLHFEVTSPDRPVTAIVEFSAGTRTHTGAQVVLSVEPLRGLEGPGGASDVETALSFAGQGEGTLQGVLRTAGPTVAGQWIGSGLRQGRLVFALRAGASGTYTVPVRFVLSAP
jgi:hypothetical protein